MERCEKDRYKTLYCGHQLGARPHQVRCPFEYPHHLLNLSIAGIGILATGEHIQRRPILHVIAKENLFPCNKLWRAQPSIIYMIEEDQVAYLGFEILRCVGIEAKLSSPF